MNFELEIHELDPMKKKVVWRQLIQASTVDAENYEEALKRAKVELRKINKNFKKDWENDEAELGISLPQSKCVITKLKVE